SSTPSQGLVRCHSHYHSTDWSNISAPDALIRQRKFSSWVRLSLLRSDFLENASLGLE
ncbi:hypothetical protein SERLADRAFT_460958, partial [Serpula lacrymans var. lacrymans S7.9]